MKSTPTMKDIADELGITVMSVSKALSGKEGVSEDLRKKIFAKAEEIGYKKGSSFKEATRNIGILVTEKALNASPSLMSIQQSLISQLFQVDYYGLTEIISDEAEHLMLEPKLVKDRKIDAFIILGQMEDSYLKMLKNIKLPFISMTFIFDDETDGSILCDNLYFGENITQYLFDKGYKSIGFIGNRLFSTTIMDRFLGYHKALIKNGAKLNEDFVIPNVNEYGEEIGLFLPDDLPEAFVCTDCRVAYKLIHQLEGMDYVIPEDFSIVAFDDGIYGDFGIPKITTYSIDYDEMAQMAAESIVVKLQDPRVKLGKKILYGKVIERESVIEKK